MIFLGLICIEGLSQRRTDTNRAFGRISGKHRERDKRYGRIAGCLLAFAGSEAIKKFKSYPALSFNT